MASNPYTHYSSSIWGKDDANDAYSNITVYNCLPDALRKWHKDGKIQAQLKDSPYDQRITMRIVTTSGYVLEKHAARWVFEYNNEFKFTDEELATIAFYID